MNVEHGTRTRKKLIEVALPLDEINTASAREVHPARATLRFRSHGFKEE